MKLKNFNTQIFAGLSDQEVSFAPGLNILLGPNEAGKSSIINAIFATLFSDPKIKRNTTKDKEFNQKFLPYPDGDYIHGSLIIEDNAKSYRIEKKWSRNNPSVLLEKPNGNLIDSPEKIDNILNEILLYGESTYDNIVFAKQSEVKAAVKKIAEESELKSTVTDFLRKAVMEMDGIVTDEIKEKIEAEKDKLLSKWDLDKHQPENPDRDVNHPYIKARGKIYDAYIEKESIKAKIRKAENSEKELHKINGEIESLEAELKAVVKKLTELSAIEADINKRSEIEPDLKRKQEKLSELNKIKKEWPELLKKNKEHKKKLKEYKQALEKLKEEKAAYDKFKLKEELEEKLSKVKELNQKIEKISSEKEKYAEVNEEIAEELVKLENKISYIDAQLLAGKLKAKINKASSALKIVKGINAEEEIEAGSEIEADGYIRVHNNDIDLEISSAEIDFEQLQEEHQSFREKYNKMINELEKLEISNSKEAREKLKTKNDLLRDSKEAQKEKAKILADKTHKELKEEHENIEVDSSSREIEVIRAEIEQLKDNKISDLKIEIKTKENKIEEWQEEYNSLEELKDKIKTLKTNSNNLQKELRKLAELPEEFNSNEEFREKIRDLRKSKEDKTEAKNDKNYKLIEIQDTMPDESLEELEEIYENKERKFNGLEDRASRLLKVEEAFSQTLKEMDEKSFEPLINSFNSYLNILTAGNYQTSKINESFDIEIIKEDANNKLPVNINLLSFGTYDSVALALRFALYENLFQDKPGFIILDDCLVNLDPERTEKAIDLIKSFKDKYQIIFSTCNPDTAARLGGNIIEF
ncbi:MAG: hypothetical protein D5S01_02720 [Halanaerobium sp. MSAO_Bac5]|nr:MAG: hypothetical protein D5S01_02720 [Halanaerobium sp. MSAO_Bac5]